VNGLRVMVSVFAVMAMVMVFVQFAMGMLALGGLGSGDHGR